MEKTTSVTVNDYDDREINGMALAYEALKNLPEAEFKRAIYWLEDRCREDRKKMVAAQQANQAGLVSYQEAKQQAFNRKEPG